MARSQVPAELISAFTNKVQLPAGWYKEVSTPCCATLALNKGFTQIDVVDSLAEHRVQQQLLNNDWVDPIESAGPEQWALLDDFVIFEQESRSAASLTRSHCGNLSIPTAR